MPAGAGAGMAIQIQSPDGRTLLVAVPAGAAPGSIFQVQLPTAPGAAHSPEGIEEQQACVEQERAPAKQDKPEPEQRAMHKFEVTLDSVEEQPFALGSFGASHLAEFQNDRVVLKKMMLTGLIASQREKIFRGFETELGIMIEMRSPRIVSVFGVVTTDPTYLGLVVEYNAGGNLRERLDDTSRPIEDQRKRLWLSDIASGMQYIYCCRIEHRDLKCMNVLLDDRERAKVTNFGLSKSNDLVTHSTGLSQGGDAAGTPVFMSPELLMDNKFDEKSVVCVTSGEAQGRKARSLMSKTSSLQVLVRNHDVGDLDARPAVSGAEPGADNCASLCEGQAAASARRARNV